MAGNSNFKPLIEFQNKYPEISQQYRTRHCVKFHDFSISNFDIFRQENDVTKLAPIANFAFSIMDIL